MIAFSIYPLMFCGNHHDYYFVTIFICCVKLKIIWSLKLMNKGYHFRTTSSKLYPEHMGVPLALSGIRVAQSTLCFVMLCRPLFVLFCSFSVGHCIVCSSFMTPNFTIGIFALFTFQNGCMPCYISVWWNKHSITNRTFWILK